MGAYKFDYAPLLAPGRHVMCLADVEQACVAAFPQSSRRADLFARLCLFVREFEDVSIRCEMLINGSFFTEKPDPSDVDIAVLIDPDVANNITFDQELLIGSVNDNDFGEDVDAFVETLFPIGHPSFRSNGNEMLWSEQYGREHNGEYLKGIAVIRVGETDVGLRIRR